MFGQSEDLADLADFLLSQFTLDELLEMNDLTELEVLQRLIEDGMIGEPEHVIEEFQD